MADPRRASDRAPRYKWLALYVEFMGSRQEFEEGIQLPGREQEICRALAETVMADPASKCAWRDPAKEVTAERFRRREGDLAPARSQDENS
jgi:hypothetical protein